MRTINITVSPVSGNFSMLFAKVNKITKINTTGGEGSWEGKVLKDPSQLKIGARGVKGSKYEYTLKEVDKVGGTVKEKKKTRTIDATGRDAVELDF
ncbi:hypothetical protein [Myxococcus sp. Y35]|uniref:hypothetical protein n=1 Tax=Pseudomyxococcus flavus TaxID=3115648 RepID=UPI003CE83D4F